MTFRTYVYDRFSPYLDDDPWVDFFDDLAQRGTTIVATVLAVHVALFFVMSTNFVVPDLKEEEPDPIPVQIIAFEDLQPEPAPEVIDIAPITPPPPPRVKPRPEPTPQPVPPPPPPPVEEVVIEREPEPIAAPLPPDILVNETPAESENTIPEFTPPEPVVEPVIEPPIVPEPIPQPIIEIFEPEPLPDPIPEPILEPVIEPAPQYEIEIFEPNPIPVPEPESIIEPEPIPEFDPFEGVEDMPLPEVITVAPLFTPEPADDNPFPEFTPPPEPVIEPRVEPTPPTTEIIVEPEIESAPIITTAPTILASPDAPSTSDEVEKAVPQEQAAPVNDFLFNPKTRFPTPPAPRGGTQRPNAPSSDGSGSNSGAISLDGGSGIPGGGTQRASTQPGGSSTGWAVAPQGGSGGFGEGGKGLMLDIRCREAKRTHANCPEYLAKFKGRNAAGYESFGAHSNGTVAGSTRGARAGTYNNPGVGGGRDPWALGPGSNSVNAGGPSSTVIEDADFGREFLGTNLGDGSQSQRMRDLLKQPTKPWDGGVIKLPEAPDEDDDDN